MGSALNKKLSLILIFGVSLFSCNKKNEIIVNPRSVYKDDEIIDTTNLEINSIELLKPLSDEIKEPLIAFITNLYEERDGYTIEREFFEQFELGEYPTDDYYVIASNSINLTSEKTLPRGFGDSFWPLRFYNGLYFGQSFEPFYYISKNSNLQQLTVDDLIPFSKVFVENNMSQTELLEMYASFFASFYGHVFYPGYKESPMKGEQQYETAKQYVDDNFEDVVQTIKNKTDLYNGVESPISNSILTGDNYWRKYYKNKDAVSINDLKYVEYSKETSSKFKKYYSLNKNNLKWKVLDRLDYCNLYYPESPKIVSVPIFDDFENVISFGEYSGYELLISTSSKQRFDDEYGYFSFESNNYGEDTRIKQLNSFYNRSLYLGDLRNDIVAFKDGGSNKRSSLTSLDVLYSQKIITDEQLKRISMQVYSHYLDSLDVSINKDDFKNTYVNKWNTFFKAGSSFRNNVIIFGE